MFSTGQWIFAAFFVVVFAAAMIYVYRKDLKLHKKYYRGSYWILLSIILFMVFLFVMKTVLKD